MKKCALEIYQYSQRSKTRILSFGLNPSILIESFLTFILISIYFTMLEISKLSTYWLEIFSKQS